MTVHEDDEPYSCTVDSGDDYLGVSSMQITQFGTIYGTNTSPPKASVRVETGPHCGNSSCETGENTANCCEDCGSTCGDGYCSPGESCFEDCGLECPPCIVCPCNQP